jgi:hypothetical protein
MIDATQHAEIRSRATLSALGLHVAEEIWSFGSSQVACTIYRRIPDLAG